MAKMLLSDLLSSVPVQIQLITSFKDPLIYGLSFDSRTLCSGDLFFAIPGVHVDGNDYVNALLDRKPGAIIMSRYPEQELIEKAQEKEITLSVCSEIRTALAWISKAWFGKPDESLTLIGVTGTDGKSSTVWYIQQLLDFLGIPSGFISTVSMQTGNEPGPNSLRQSTPEAPEIFQLLQTMVQKGKTHGVIEATSHGLSDRTARLAAIDFQTGVFTNISHEHLEFHGTFEQYLFDKANLFRKVRGKKPSNTQPKYPIPHGIINAQSPYAKYLASTLGDGCTIWYYGVKDKIPPENQDLPLALWAQEVKESTHGVSARLVYSDSGEKVETESFQVTLSMAGSFNLENVMAAALAVWAQGIKPLSSILNYVPRLQGVKGRMRIIQGNQPFSVIVDYAHTPGSFEKVFPLFRSITLGKLIAIFGSGGERDQGKRPIQGKIAGAFADVLILSNEDPRLESPQQILEEIAQGVDNPRVEIHLIEDRYRAIRYALEIADPGDTLVLLGKGHEQSIIIGQEKTPWDEESKVREALVEAGYLLYEN